MAIDSEAKRKSAVMFLMPGYTPLLESDGSMTQADMQAAAWLYNGILAGAAAVIALAAGIVKAAFTGKISGVVFTGKRGEVAFTGKRGEVTFTGG